MSECFGFVQHSVTASNGDKEGTPVAILEASLAGMPIISTSHAGIKDAVEHNITGVLSEEYDVDEKELNNNSTIPVKNNSTIFYPIGPFSPNYSTNFGLTRDQAAKRFHVMHDGELISGIPAFAALWQQMPGLKWLAWIVSLPLIRTVAALVYDYILAPLLFTLHKRREARGNAKKIA